MSHDLDFSFDVSVSGEQLLDGNGQLGRVAWLSKRIRRDDFFLLQDGSYSKLLFSELLQCYVAGHFIATCVLGFSLIERTIAGRLSFIGDPAAARYKSEDLLNVARDQGWLSESEFQKLDALRATRNPIVHFRAPLSSSRPEVKAAVAGRSTAQLLEFDAKAILKTAIQILRKTKL